MLRVVFWSIVVSILAGQAAVAAFGFSDSAPLNTGAATDGSSSDEEPSVASGGGGVWVSVWSSTNTLNGTIGSDTDILFARSTDNGATWSENALLNSYGATDEFGDFQPRLASDGNGNWVCVWYSSNSFGGTIGNDYDIIASHSTDNGQTWSEAVVVNSNADTDGSARDEYVSIASDGKGNWVCVWYSDAVLGSSDRDDSDILVARSSNNGATWSEVETLNTDAATDTAYDQDPRVETDRAGTWIAVWESDNTLDDTVGPDGELLFAKSTDNGVTWSTNKALNTDAPTDTGYETFPSIATDRTGNWVVVWEGKIEVEGSESADYETVAASSNDNGDTWSAPVAINNDAVEDSSYDSSPSVATDRVGNWIAIWRKDGDSGSPFGDDNDIVASLSTDNGLTWTALDALNGSLLTDSGGDDINALAADGLGHWVAVWRSNDSLGSTIGTDVDILVSTLTIDIPVFTITKPNGGEKWKIGDSEKITWDYDAKAGGKVTIELLKNGTVVETIKNKTKNDGAYSWTVPNSVSKGSGYSVRVKLKSDKRVQDQSDATFKVK